MTEVNRIALAVLALLLSAVSATTAMAAPKAFCQNYAQTAVNQTNHMHARNLGCGGFRWHNWYEGHYEWCRSVSKASAQSETTVRKRAMFGGPC